MNATLHLMANILNIPFTFNSNLSMVVNGSAIHLHCTWLAIGVKNSQPFIPRWIWKSWTFLESGSSINSHVSPLGSLTYRKEKSIWLNGCISRTDKVAPIHPNTALLYHFNPSICQKFKIKHSTCDLFHSKSKLLWLISEQCKRVRLPLLAYFYFYVSFRN